MNLNTSSLRRYGYLGARRLGLFVAAAAVLVMSIVTVTLGTAERDANGDSQRVTVVATDRHTATTTTPPTIVNGGEVVRAPAWPGEGWPGTRGWYGGGWTGR